MSELVKKWNELVFKLKHLCSIYVGVVYVCKCISVSVRVCWCVCVCTWTCVYIGVYIVFTVKLLLTFLVLVSATLASDRSTSSNMRDCKSTPSRVNTHPTNTLTGTVLFSVTQLTLSLVQLRSVWSVNWLWSDNSSKPIIRWEQARDGVCVCIISNPGELWKIWSSNSSFVVGTDRSQQMHTVMKRNSH